MTRDRRLPVAAVAAAAVLILALSACTSGASTEGSRTSPPAEATASEPAEADGEGGGSPPGADAPDPFASVGVLPAPDPEYYASLEAAGLDPVSSAFLVLTESSVEVVSPEEFVIGHDFPNGETASLTYRLYRAPADAADGPVEADWTITDDGARLRMAYAIPAGDLPPDMQEWLPGLPDVVPAGAQEAAGAQITPLGLAPSGPLVVRQAIDREQALGVIVNGTVSAGTKAGVGAATAWLEGIPQQLKDAGKPLDSKVGEAAFKAPSAGWKAWKAGGKIVDAALVSGPIADALRRLDELAQCAENPTSPLARETVRRDPAQRDATLKTLQDTKDEIVGDTLTLYTSLLADTGSSLIKVPGVGFIAGQATKYIKTTLSAHIQQLLKEAEAAVVPCTGWYIRYNVAAMEVTGEKCGGMGGLWEATGKMNVPGGTARFIWEAVINERTLKGPAVWTAVVDVGQQVKTRLKGKALLVEDKDGSVTVEMTFDGRGSVSIPGRTQSFVSPPEGGLRWLPDPELASCS